MKNQHFSILERIKSFGYAFNGLRIFVKEEHNARIHLFAAFCTVVGGVILNISIFDWIAIAFAVGFVLTIEIVNSIIENIANYISPERDEMIKKIKDLSAAGVLVSSITALTIGLIVFLPKIIAL